MTTPWLKALRDLWRERTRTAFVVLAVALGLAAFTAVMSAYAILTRELDEGYLATNPASATLRVDRADDDLVAAVAAHPGVAEAEARRSLSGRVRTGPAEWRNLTLFVVKDYGRIRVSTLKPQSGAWPPAAGEMLVERDAMNVVRARVGDSLTVRTSAGREQQLRVAGTVHDVGQAQARMENSVYGYVTLDTLKLLGEEPYLNELKLLAAGDRFDEAHARAVAEDVKQLVESRGRTVRRVDVPAPGRHPHADLMGLLLLSISSFGLFALALAGVIVVNLLAALVGAQVRQIGVMKAVGATRRQVARIYLGQALALGAAAFLVSLPAGVLGGRALCRAMAVFLNFDIDSFAVPAWVYLLGAAVGLAVPLLAAAYPVWRGSGVSVREALSDYGVGRDAFGAGRLDRALAGVGGASRPLLLAVRNGFRRRARLALTLVTLASGGLFFMSALNVRASMIRTLDRLFAARAYDLSVSLGAMYPSERVERAALSTPGVVGAEGWIATEGARVGADEAATVGAGGGHTAAGGLHGGGVAAAAAPTGERFSVVGLPSETRMIRPELIAGRWLLPGETDAVVLNTALAAKWRGVKAGDSVTLRLGPDQSPWRVVGVAREPFSPGVAYVPLGYFGRRGDHAGMANNVRLALAADDPAAVNAVRAGLDEKLGREGVRALGSTSKGETRFSFDQHMVMIYVFLVVVAAVLGGVGGLGLMTTMSLNVLERRRELGVMRAIGATPRVVRLVVAAEGVAVGVLGWAMAAALAWPVGTAVGNFLSGAMFKSGLDFAFDPRGPMVWLGVSIMLGAAASFLPAWHASRRPVREAVEYE